MYLFFMATLSSFDSSLPDIQRFKSSLKPLEAGLDTLIGPEQ